MEKFFLIGRVVKPHGVKGKINVEYFGEGLDNFLLYKEIYIKDQNGQLKSYEVIQANPKPPRIILHLKGINRIEEAVNLKGKEIFIKREDLPLLNEGEYYWVDLIGMIVKTERGKIIGKIKSILPTGANDVIIIEGKRKEIFLPAIEDVIKRVDLENRVMEVKRMEGLWEDSDEI